MKTEKHEDRSHAVASPSGYRRWMGCSGSLNLERKLKNKGLIPEYEESSPAAAEGTRLHEVAEKVLTGEILICPSEVMPYVSYCRDTTPEGAEVFIEERVPLFYSKEGETGSVDYAWRKDDVLEVVDLKTGRIKVDPVFNYQGLIYAMGLVTTAVKEIRITIFQYDEPFTWAISIQEANELCHVIKNAAHKALDENNNDLTASDDACRWCACRPYCTEHTDGFFDVVENSVAGEMVRITDDKLVWILSHKKKIESFLASVENVLYERCDAGEAIKGVHIEQGRKGNKTWDKDINAVEHMIKNGIHLDEAQVSKPITPTQALKLNPDLDGWYQPAGKNKIVCNNASSLIEDFETL